MKVRSDKYGQCEVRLTRQSQSAKYGAGCWIVRLMVNGRKSSEHSFPGCRESEALASYEAESKYAMSLAQVCGTPMAQSRLDLLKSHAISKSQFVATVRECQVDGSYFELLSLAGVKCSGNTGTSAMRKLGNFCRLLKGERGNEFYAAFFN